MRVFARLTGDERNILLPAVKKEATARLAAIYPAGNDAAYLTQGLMELGETVCIPNGAPHCNECPVSDFCEARRTNATDRLPVRIKDKTRRREMRTVFLFISPSGNIAIRKRPPTGLLASLFEFPNIEGHMDEDGVRSRAASFGLTPIAVSGIGNAKHLFTHIEWEMRGYRVAVKEESGDGLLFVTPTALMNRYAVASAFRFYKKQVVEE